LFSSEWIDSSGKMRLEEVRGRGEKAKSLPDKETLQPALRYLARGMRSGHYGGLDHSGCTGLDTSME
jgi:hypothetical protein